MDIIQFLLDTIQQLYAIIGWLLNFICRYIPLKQWAFDDSHSPKYQKFKVDELPRIQPYAQDWDWKDLYNISISHQQVANYCKTAAVCIKPFVDHYDYQPENILTGDETYIRIRGQKGYVWFIMDAIKKSILGYQVSDNRGVGPCILTMRMALRNFKEKLPDHFQFIADGYSAYPLAAQQFFREFGEKFRFSITQVIGLTNDDAISTQFRPYKQMIERLNRTYKHSYRPTNGFDNINGANYDLALWVAYYNFLRPHEARKYKVLNEVKELASAENMPGKWQILIYLGQQTILDLQTHPAAS